jgi:hypothetical protein
MDTWQALVPLKVSNRMLGLRPVILTGVSDRPEAGIVKSLMALFFGDAYK